MSSAAPALADERHDCAEAAERAQALRQDAKLRAARTELLACSSPRCPAIVRDDCVKWLGEVQEEMPTIVVRAHDARGRDVAGVRVLVDGAPLVSRLDGVAVGVDPGAHRFRFEAASGAATELQLVISEGDKRRPVQIAFDVPLELDGTAAGGDSTAGASTPTASASGPPSPIPLYVVGGIGVAALASFTYFELKGQADYRSLRDGCARTRSCAEADVDSARTELVVGLVSLGTAALAAGVFTWLLLGHRGSSTASASTAPLLDVHAVQGGGLLEYRGRL